MSGLWSISEHAVPPATALRLQSIRWAAAAAGGAGPRRAPLRGCAALRCMAWRRGRTDAAARPPTHPPPPTHAGTRR
jgi:hypothetical protein